MGFENSPFLLVVLVLFLVTMVLFWKGSVLFSDKELTIKEVIHSAELGKESITYFVPDISYDLCEFEGATGDCGFSEFGAEGDCYVRENKRYSVRVYPTETGICLNITRVG